MIRLAGDPAYRACLQDGARRFVVEECDWDRLAAVYSTAYARLLGASPGDAANATSLPAMTDGRASI